jgi:CRP/FNR family transcriptional regulator
MTAPIDKIHVVLSQTPLFSGLEPPDLRQVRRIAAERSYAKAQIIFSEGDPGDGFHVIMEGHVKVFKVSSEGKEQILHMLGPTEPFGEAAVFFGRRFPASAQALGSAKTLFFPRTAFVDVIQQQPSLALNMLAVLSLRLHQFAAQVEALSLKEVPGRLAGYLLFLVETQNAAGSVQLTISKGHLASLLGTIPETLSRIFARMSDQGLIRVRGRTIDVLDFERLQALAQQGKSLE